MDTELEFGRSHTELQRELETAKDTLIVLNENIKRIVGRSKHIKDSRSEKKCSYEAKYNEIERLKNKLPESSISKRGNDSKSIFNRLSLPSTRYIDESKPRLTSRVIRELPSRQEIVAAQCADSESRARNRRIFSSLLGTLHKFCQEESRLKQKEEKKAQIEKKLEEQELLERESLRKERESLFYYRKRKQTEIKSLEQKISRIKDFEAWEFSMHNMKPFIKTKTNPKIYFKPKILNIKTEKLLSDCQDTICKLIHERRVMLNQDLLSLEENLKTEDINMEDGCLEKTCQTSNSNNRIVSIIKEGKGGLDFKENKIGNSPEPALESGVVVVKY